MEIKNIINGKYTVNHFIEMIGNEFSLLKEFKNTQQDSIWHGEGDVHIHTDMVLNEVYDLIANQASYLSDDDKFCLVMGALLHDIAKPLTTKESERNGRICIIAPGHDFFIEDNLKYKNIFINSIFLANKILFLNNELKTYAKIELEKSIVYIFTDNQNFYLIENDFEGNSIKSKKFKFNNINKIEHLIIYLSNYLDMKEEFLNKLNEIGISKINKEFFKINDIINY